MKKFSSILLIILLSIGLYIWMSYHKLIQSNNHVVEQWQQLQIMYYRRNSLTPDLITLLQQRGKLQPGLALVVTNTYHQVKMVGFIPAYKNAKQMAAYIKAQNNIETLLIELLAIGNEDPEISKNPEFIRAIRIFEDALRRVQEGKKIYNNNVAQYNEMIAYYPTKWIAELFGYKPRIYYQEPKTPQSLKLNRIESLLQHNDHPENILFNGI